MNRLVAIVGPTGTGKSALALRLVQNFDGEIVGAVSRQIYRYLDIGTAKPAAEEMSLAPYHLIDIVNPDEDFSLAQYQDLACRTIADIQQRGKLTLLVGGSGLYIWSVLEGWGIPRVPPDPEFRHSLEQEVAVDGGARLYRELTAVDPAAAQRIDHRNVRRVIRALEVHRGRETSQPQNNPAPLFDALIIGLTAARAELYRRIDSRVDEMIERGLVAEVTGLVNKGYAFNLPAMSGIGYQEIGMFLEGQLSLATATQQIKYETHRFVRHQYAWFKLKDARIQWFDVQGDVEPEITAAVADYIGGES